MAHTPAPDDPGFISDRAPRDNAARTAPHGDRLADTGTKSLGAATPSADPTRAAHDALDRAIVNVGKGIETYPVVNVTTLTDELRAAGVQITVGRHGRPAHYGRPAAAERARGAAPFGSGTRVELVKRFGGPHQIGDEAEVQRVYKRGGDSGYLCAVEWLPDRSVNNGLPVEYFQVATGPDAYTGREPGDRDGRPRAATPEPDDQPDLYRLTIVVSGAPFEVDAHPSDYVGDVIGRGITAAGIGHTEEAITWHLRTEDGTVIDAGTRLGEHGLLTSKPLFLDPEAGGGATADELTAKAEAEGLMWPKGSPQRRLIERQTQAAHDLAADLAAGEGWKGTPPAEGTRRRLIFGAIMAHKVFRTVGKETAEKTALEIADEVEMSLLQSAIDNEAMARGAEALTDGIVHVDVPSVSQRKCRGEVRPPWWGETPAEGTRRKLIGDVLRAEDVLSESEVRGFADAIELALLEVGKVNDLFGLDHDGAVVLEETIGPDPVTELRVVVDHDTPASLMHAGPKYIGLFDQHGRDFGYGEWVHSTSKPGVSTFVVRVKPWQGDRQKLEVEAIGWLSAELAARAGAWAGNAPDWFPEPPEWLELWDKAIAAVRAGEPLPQPPERPAATFETDKAALRRISGELVEANRERIGAGNELDRVSIPRSLEPGTTLPLPERVKKLVERSLKAEEVGRVAREQLTELGPEDRGFLEQLVKNYLDEGGDFLIYSPVFARELLGILRRPHVGVPREDAEGPRDGELRIVLEPTEEGDRFVELEDGEGNSVSLPRVRSERRPFTEIVIPPPAVLAIGDGLSEHTGERIAKALETLNTSAGGALRELLDRSQA